MAGGINKVIIVGNLGKDPEIRHLDNGVSLARFPVATSESFIDKQTNEKRTVTEWHNVVLWRRLAEIAEKFLSKGKQVYIEGKLKTRQWTDAEGKTRYTTEIVGDNLQLLGRAPQDNQGAQSSTYPSQEKVTESNTVQEPDVNMEDDLPF